MQVSRPQGPALQPQTPSSGRPSAPPAAQEDHSWREAVGAELLELSTRWRKDDVDALAQAARDAGNSLKGAWSSIKSGVAGALGIEVVRENLSESTRETLTRVAETVAYGAGYTASGVMGLAGFVKLRSGLRRNDRARFMDGLANLAAGASIAASVAGLGPLRAVLAPLAAGFGVARGASNALAGYAKGERRKEIQGILDGTRSVGTLCSLGSAVLGPLAVVAAVVAPVAGAIQAGRGIHDLKVGLQKSDNKKELNGLADLGVAVGTTLALTGVGTIPGIALTVVCSTVKALYQFHKGSRKRIDRTLDKVEPRLQRGLEKLDRATRPLTRRLAPVHRKIADKLARLVSRPLPWKKGPKPPAEPGSDPQPPAGEAPSPTGALPQASRPAGESAAS